MNQVESTTARKLLVNGNVHCVRIPPSLDGLTEVRRFVDEAHLEDLLAVERVFDLKVSVSEAAANAIEHAGSAVSLWLWKLSDRVVVDIANEGRFTSRSSVRRDDVVRGFGLGIMVSLADEAVFTGSKGGKTTVRLTFLARDQAKARRAADSTEPDPPNLSH